MAFIKSVQASEILDSSGHPTILAKIQLDNGVTTATGVPSDLNTGTYEAKELRDNDPSRFQGYGVQQAVEIINNQVNRQLQGRDPKNQRDLDQVLTSLDGTPNKEKIGANTILAVSQTLAAVAAQDQSIPLYQWIAQLINNQAPKTPTPIFTIISGGPVGDGNLDFQEFSIVPQTKLPLRAKVRHAVEIFMKTKEVLARHKAIQSTSDHGGFLPHLFTNLDAFTVIKEAVAKCGFSLGQEFIFALDVAATDLYKKSKYYIRDFTGEVATHEYIEYFKDLIQQYPVFILEDPISQDDWNGWKSLGQELPKNVLLAGDWLFSMNKHQLEEGIKQHVANAIIIKPAAIGTISETLDIIQIARQSGLKIIIPHHRGETNDTFLADFSFGISADYVKFGAPYRGERVTKYNRLIDIEEENQQPETININNQLPPDLIPPSDPIQEFAQIDNLRPGDPVQIEI